MAPDKLWVTPSEMTSLLSKKRHDYDVCYIRKDAIFEWADNWKKLGVSEDFLYAMETLKLHLNSM